MEQVATTVMDIEIDRENATNFDLHLSTWLLNVDFEAARDTLRLSALMADQAHQLIEALRLVQQRLHPTAAEAVQWTSTLHHIPRRPVRNVGLTSDRVCRGGFRLRQYAFPPTRLQAVRDLAIKEATYRERPRRGNNFGPQRAPPPLPKRVIWASCAERQITPYPTRLIVGNHVHRHQRWREDAISKDVTCRHPSAFEGSCKAPGGLRLLASQIETYRHRPPIREGRQSRPVPPLGGAGLHQGSDPRLHYRGIGSKASNKLGARDR